MRQNAATPSSPAASAADPAPDEPATAATEPTATESASRGVARRARSIAVLGAGALGMTAALRLAERGHRVTVIEREPLPGGLAAGFEIEPGIWLEKFYHHLFRTDRHAIRLIGELGLGERLEWRAPVTATLRDGRLHELDSPASLLRFRPLPVADRLRMGAAIAVLKAMPTPRLLEGRTAASWLRRWMGERAYDVVWGPLLEAKFGETADEIAMPWFWARVHDRTQRLGYLRGGFQQLYQRLAERVQSPRAEASAAAAAGAGGGGEMRLGATVTSVRTARGGLIVETDAGAERFDSVISTLAVRLTARLVDELPASWRARHEWGRAFGAHSLILALDRPLTPHAYWVNVNDPGYPFLALVEHTNYIPSFDYGGRHLVYLGNYRPMDDPLMTEPKESVLDAFVPALTRLNPEFDRSWITGSWSFAAPYAQPIVTVDYRDHIPPFLTPVPGLFVSSMFQVYPHDRGQNQSIRLGERVAALVARS